MSKETNTTIGHLIDENQERDAIHIAVAPAKASESLKPGQHIGFKEDGTATSKLPSAKYIGIVDPFLNGSVMPGQHFWMFLYPNTITSLKHNWTHPAFAKPKDMSESEKYVRDLADSVGISYSRLMTHAAYVVEDLKSGSSYPDYIIGGSEMEGESVPEEFWDHFEILTGKKVDAAHRQSFFSCSC